MALERVDGIDSGFARPKLGLAFAARHAEALLVLLVLGVALRRGDHARLPRRRHEPVRARGAAAPWPRGLWPIAPDRLAYAARHPHRLADSDCALAVVADWKSAHAIPRGLSAL